MEKKFSHFSLTSHSYTAAVWKRNGLVLDSIERVLACYVVRILQNGCTFAIKLMKVFRNFLRNFLSSLNENYSVTSLTSVYIYKGIELNGSDWSYREYTWPT